MYTIEKYRKNVSTYWFRDNLYQIENTFFGECKKMDNKLSITCTQQGWECKLNQDRKGVISASNGHFKRRDWGKH